MQFNLLKKLSARAALPPGTLTPPPDDQLETSIDMAVYDKDDFILQENIPAANLSAPLKDGRRLWIRMTGLASLDAIKKAGEIFSLHQLLLEDVTNTAHRPKTEEFDDYLFMVIRLLDFDEKSIRINTNHVSIVMGTDWLITFEERPSRQLDGVMDRLRQGRGRLPTHGIDYLTYAVLDSIVDSYFITMADLIAVAEPIEQQVLRNPAGVSPNTLYEIKNQAGRLHRLLWPLREVTAHLERDESGLFSPAVEPFLRDLYDHTTQVVELADSIREQVSGLVELHLSVMGYRTNEVMRVLTVIASIFIPLTFIAGLYGMNFKYMPELDLPYAYPVALAAMGGVALGLLIFFKKKKWL